MSMQSASSLSEVNAITAMPYSAALVEMTQTASGVWIPKNRQDLTQSRGRGGAGSGMGAGLGQGQSQAAANALLRRSSANSVSERWDSRQSGMTANQADVINMNRNASWQQGRAAGSSWRMMQEPTAYNMLGRSVQADILATFIDLYV